MSIVEPGEAVKPARRGRTRKRKALEWVITLVVASVAVLVLQAEVAKPYVIPSSSMEPTLHCARGGEGCLGRFSDRVIALRLVYRFTEPRRGQIVVFRAPERALTLCGSGGRTFVKRLIGLPGETVSERRGRIFIDGSPLHEPYVDSSLRGSEAERWPTVAADHYFFLGDNRVGSCDSRVWGTVPRSDLIGPAVVTYWPPNRLTAR